MRTDVYDKITNQIVAELEKGVRPWHKPWNAEHAAGRITRPLRANGIPYQGINVLMLWSAAMEKGYAAPIWMTFKQALELKACVRKGEHGSLVVYADKIIRAETDTDTGEESEHAIPFMKGYTVFNVEQVDGLPEQFYAKPAPRSETVQRRGSVSHSRREPQAVLMKTISVSEKSHFLRAKLDLQWKDSSVYQRLAGKGSCEATDRSSLSRT